MGWGLRWSSLWGYETLYWHAEWTCSGPRKFYGPWHWSLRWSSLWGYEMLCWACRMNMRWAAEILWTLALGPSVELPMGLRNAVLGVPNGHAVGRGNSMDPGTGAFGGAPYGATKRCAATASH